MEEKTLAEGGPRVRFQANWKGTLDSFLERHPRAVRDFEATCLSLKTHLAALEKLGVTPVLPDGKVGGNGGAVLNIDGKDYLLVSKSGKSANTFMDTYKDFALVESFNKKNWSCEYYSNSKDTLPTSDTPLHFAALTAHSSFNWSTRPVYLLHGHAFATEQDAEKMGFPISVEETLCSTPDDSQALVDLLRDYSFPQHKIFIRKGHGFVLLGEGAEDAWDVLSNQIKPHLTTGLDISGHILSIALKISKMLDAMSSVFYL